MLQFSFQIYFIFLLCVIIQVNYCVSQEHAAAGAAYLPDIEPSEKCTLRNCPCTEVPQWNGVDCRNYSGYLSNFSKLYFNSFKYIPGRMFSGLSIFSITLRDPDVTLAENFLEGILFLHDFEVERSSIKVIPDLRFVKDNITYVTIASSHLTSLEGEHLQNLTSVRVLSFFNNSIRYIDPDVLWGTYNVQTLDFSHNKLTSIPPNLLDPMKGLISFSASHNNLLHVDNLFSVTRPLLIYLAFNNITNFSLTQLFSLENVQPFYTFNMNELDLSYNFIKDTPFSISACNLNNGFILKIRDLSLNGNDMLNLNEYLRCTKFQTLEIVGNQIQFLAEINFLLVYDVEELLLRGNRIHRIDTDTFKSFNTSLRVLDLSSNEITSINGSVRYLSNLSTLNLSLNAIQIFAEDEFTGLYTLYKLYLQLNQIKSLGTAFQKLEKLDFLNITHNDIKLIKPEQVPITVKYIYLTDNPLSCDCKNLPFINMLKDDKETGMCLRSELENSIRKHLNCPDVCSCKCTKYEDSFSMFVDCSSRNLSLVPHFMENNSAQLKVNATFSSDGRRYHVMYQNMDPALHLEDNVLGISLENNRLDNLDEARLPPNLVQLFLSNNKLRRFPQSLFDSQLSLKQVSLSGNPWKCDCDALEFKKWLTTNNYIIKDFLNVRCAKSDKGGENLNGSIIWELSDSDLCPTIDLELTLSVSLGALSFITFCLFAKVIYSRYELNIKIFLYSRGFTFVKEEALDRDKAFDAFISFAHEDDEFVITEIVSEIEKRDPNIYLCLHYRHFRPGESISDNITHAVQNSKRTVVILSRHFLRSEWCFLEFQIAHIQTLQDKVHRIIAVKIGELPKEIDPTIKLYLDSTTYLTWGETNFWNKLLHILPSRSSAKSPVLRFVGDKEIIFNFSSFEI